MVLYNHGKGNSTLTPEPTTAYNLMVCGTGYKAQDVRDKYWNPGRYTSKVDPMTDSGQKSERATSPHPVNYK